MSWWNNNDDFDFSKDIDIDVDADFDVDWDFYNDYDSYVDISHEVCSDIDLDGNSALLDANVEAVGDDTLVEVSAVVLTTDDYSGVTLTAFSAVD